MRDLEFEARDRNQGRDRDDQEMRDGSKVGASRSDPRPRKTEHIHGSHIDAGVVLDLESRIDIGVVLIPESHVDAGVVHVHVDMSIGVRTLPRSNGPTTLLWTP